MVGYSHVVEPWHEADGSQDQHGRGLFAKVFTYDPSKEEGAPNPPTMKMNTASTIERHGGLTGMLLSSNCSSSKSSFLVWRATICPNLRYFTFPLCTLRTKFSAKKINLKLCNKWAGLLFSWATHPQIRKLPNIMVAEERRINYSTGSVSSCL